MTVGVAAALTVVIALAALLATRRRDTFAPLGLVCLLTVAVLGIDVMTGSRLQLETPFGLSMTEAGRFYGIGNEALGIYGVTALFAASWLGCLALRRYPSSPRPALAAVAAVAAVGFGLVSSWAAARSPCCSVSPPGITRTCGSSPRCAMAAR